MIKCTRDKYNESVIFCEDSDGLKLSFKCREPMLPSYDDIPGGYYGLPPSQSISCYGKRYASDVFNSHMDLFAYVALAAALLGGTLALMFRRR